jgi:haloacid dehalogenase superfamily, subfamily IA, variant 1 with third motif having Dx(3-4)D or Dx(3-4)E
VDPIATPTPVTQKDSLIAAALGADLLWRNIRHLPCTNPRPALFLDRDGVIIKEYQYLSDPNRMVLLSGIDTLIKTARARGYAVICVTNQGGIGLGLFGWKEFAAMETHLAELLAQYGAAVDGIFACPFHPLGQSPYRIDDHPWRKPNPGMLIEAARYLNLDLHRSLMLGDKASDMLAARAAGLPRGVHLLTGHGREEEGGSRAAVTTSFEVIVAATPDASAIDLLLRPAF